MSSVEIKIKALLALANPETNNNQTEAEAALKKALELMAKYEVSEEALNSHFTEAIIELTYPLKKQMIFKGCQTLVVLLAKHFKVFVYKKGAEFVLIGHESKLRSCVAMTDYLLQNSKNKLPKGYSYTEKQGYYCGYFLAIKKALTDIPKTTDEKGLLLIDTAFKEYEKLAGVLRPATNRVINCDKAAKELGSNIGNNTNLNKQLGVRALSGN